MKFILLFGLLFCISSHAFTLIDPALTAGWNTKTLTFDVNESSCTGLGVTSADLNTAIDAAVTLWNSAPTSSLKIAKGTLVTGTSNASNPVIYCTNTLTGGIAGVGTAGTITGGRPIAGSLALNGNSAASAYFNSLGVTYRAIVVAHEMGHVLGLGHSEKTYALMYYDISTKQNLSLSQDDVDGITWLNPRSDFSDGIMGCGTVKNKNDHFPPTSGNAALVFNWILLFLIALGATKLAKVPASAALVFKTNVLWHRRSAHFSRL